MKSAIEETGFPYSLSKIDPSKDPRYSQNLYRWLRGRHGQSGNWHIYRFEGAYLIGRLDSLGEFVGTRLAWVLGEGGHTPFLTLTRLKVPPSHEVKTFWTRYLRVGKCVLDPKHASYLAGRYDSDRRDTHRTCRFCGKTFKKTVKKRRIVTEDVVWVET